MENGKFATSDSRRISAEPRVSFEAIPLLKFHRFFRAYCIMKSKFFVRFAQENAGFSNTAAAKSKNRHLAWELLRQHNMMFMI